MNKLKQRWGIDSNFQLTVIFIVFAVTGSTSAYLSKPILNLFDITKDNTALWIYYPLYLILVFPVYQILLVLYGFLFGQFSFFWAFEKKMLNGMGIRLFSDKKNSHN